MKLFRNCIILWILAVAFVFCASRCHAQFLRSGVLVSVATKPAGGTARVNSLRDGLMAYWKFDETAAAANLADAHTNGLELLQVSDPGTNFGFIGQSRTNASTDYFWTNNAAFNAPASMTVAGWFRVPNATFAATRALVWKYDGALNQRGFALSLATDGQVQWTTSSNGTGQAVVKSVSTASDSTWCFVAANFDSAADTASVRVGSGATLNGWNSTNQIGKVLFGSTAPLTIGVGRNNGAFTLPMIGLQDEWGFWTNTLTDAQITNLFNGGSGLPYGSFD